MSERKQIEWNGKNEWASILRGMENVGDEVIYIPCKYYTSLNGTRQRLRNESESNWSFKLGNRLITVRKIK